MFLLFLSCSNCAHDFHVMAGAKNPKAWLWITIWLNISCSLVWPQWRSFADVSQQRVDFSKKISKIKIIFWFDFHRCSHGPSKIWRHFRNKSRSILKLSKNEFYKKRGPKSIFFKYFFLTWSEPQFYSTGVGAVVKTIQIKHP